MTRIANLLIWASLFTALFLPLGAHAVKKDNLYLFSAVKGRIVKNGEPVVGIKVERSTSWNMEKEPRLETTYTDEQGFYSFPEMTGSAEFGFLAKLFHVPVVLQRVRAHEGAKEITLYVNSRQNYDSPEKEHERTLRLLADIEKAEQVVEEMYSVESKELNSDEEF